MTAVFVCIKKSLNWYLCILKKIFLVTKNAKHKTTPESVKNNAPQL